jgi:hypothetical protein
VGGVGLEGLQGLKLVIITKNGFCSDHATYTGFRFVADWSYGGLQSGGSTLFSQNKMQHTPVHTRIKIKIGENLVEPE